MEKNRMSTKDQETTKEVMAQIYYTGHGDPSKIRVFVENGSVTLKGTVPTILSRQVVYDAASGVRGVVSVDNQIRIESPSGDDISEDDTIMERVKNVIEWNPDLGGANIDFKVNNGVVTLEGSVDVFWKKLHAQELVSYIRGVVETINNLSVVPTNRVKDEIIARQVRESLGRNALIETDEVSLKVENGLVTLYGNVKNWATKNAAYFTALRAPGVLHVDNRLNIRP